MSQAIFMQEKMFFEICSPGEWNKHTRFFFLSQSAKENAVYKWNVVCLFCLLSAQNSIDEKVDEKTFIFFDAEETQNCSGLRAAKILVFVHTVNYRIQSSSASTPVYHGLRIMFALQIEFIAALYIVFIKKRRTRKTLCLNIDSVWRQYRTQMMIIFSVRDETLYQNNITSTMKPIWLFGTQRMTADLASDKMESIIHTQKKCFLVQVHEYETKLLHRSQGSKLHLLLTGFNSNPLMSETPKIAALQLLWKQPKVFIIHSLFKHTRCK